KPVGPLHTGLFAEACTGAGQPLVQRAAHEAAAVRELDVGIGHPHVGPDHLDGPPAQELALALLGPEPPDVKRCHVLGCLPLAIQRASTSPTPPEYARPEELNPALT